jgi:asparagine synthetase B (glutamine-hydrolysing)
MLSALEIAAGFPLPLRRRPDRLVRSSVEPRVAFGESLVPALGRPPCIVSFSGGRDSSLVLAIAVEVARREGLPLPVPVTVRFSADPASAEDEWQQLVIRHLGLDDWVRVDVADDLDCIGPAAQQILLRHGVLWPANVHFHLPQLERAKGGSVVTGVGGDEMFSLSGWARLRSVLGGKARPEPRDALRLAAAMSPRPVRRRITIARNEVELEWLTRDAQREVIAALADEAGGEPVRWRQRFDWLSSLRYLEIGKRSLDLVARDWDVQMHHPFLASSFVSALALLSRSARFTDRTEALESLFAGLLPRGLESRSSKAVFADALWGSASREFVAGWDGSGVDPKQVDLRALRRRWQTELTPGPHSLLQSLWLAQALASASSRTSSASGRANHDRGLRSSQAGSTLS